MIRKFYDTATAEPATQTQPSIAELMAKSGVMNSTGNSVATPISIQEKQEEPNTAQEPTPAATANEAPNAEQAKPETPSPENVVAEQPKPQIEETAKPQPSWQEVLKSQQPDTVLKELGYDDKMVSLIGQLKEFDPKVAGLVQAYKEGKHGEYLKELSTDYKEMKAEDVMRHQLRQEYPRASKEAFEAIYEDEIIERYKLDPERFAETEVNKGRLLLEAKADNYRDKLIQNQENYLLPKAPEPKIAEVDNTTELVQQEINSQKSYVSSSDYVRNIAASKTLSIGDGEDKFTYPVENPAEIIDILYDPEKWISTISDVTKQDNGQIKITPKAETQFLVGMVAKHGRTFLDAYAKHYKSLGGKAAIEPIDNASEVVGGNQQQQAQALPSNPAEAMARGGKLNSGGYNR